jgi:hypothetical protein
MPAHPKVRALMAQVRGQLKRAILNSLFRQATNSVKLLDILDAYQDAMVMGVKGGRVIEATSQAGHSTKFRTPNPGEHFRPEDLAEMTQELLEVYNDALVTLSAQGNSSPTDTQSVAVMLADDRLASITLTRSDFSLIRYPNRG